MHSGKDNGFGLNRGGTLGKSKAVADIIGQILYFRLLVVVSQQYNAFFTLYPQDFLLQQPRVGNGGYLHFFLFKQAFPAERFRFGNLFGANTRKVDTTANVASKYDLMPF